MAEQRYMVMQDTVVIYIHEQDAARPGWAVLNADGSVRESSYRDSADGLAQLAEDKKVIVVVPAENVLLTSINLPKMNRTRLLQAIPFAIEEQLIEDVDKLHFAAGDYQPNGNLSVTIVAKTKMQEWMSLLSGWNIKPDILIPDYFALPLTADTWSMCIHDEMAVVRTYALTGFACDKNNLADFMTVAMSASELKPQFIEIHNYTNHAFTAALGVTVSVKEDFLPFEQYIADIAHNAAKTPYINLLQGAYAVKRSRLPQMGIVWKMTSYLAIAWVALLFLYPTISHFILNSRVSEVDNQIAQIYKRNFPQSSSIVAPKMRMQEKLQKLSAESGENHLLMILGYVGKALQGAEGIKLKHVEFQNTQLTLELTANTSEQFAAFSDFLTKQGLSVKQQNANFVRGHMNASLLIE